MLLRVVSNVIFAILLFLALLGCINTYHVVWGGVTDEINIGLLPKGIAWIVLFVLFLIFRTIEFLKYRLSTKKPAKNDGSDRNLKSR